MSRSATNSPKRPRGRPPVAAVYPPAGAEYLTIKEVATKLRVSEDTVSRLLAGTPEEPPELSSVKVGALNVRISVYALNEYLAKQTRQAGVVQVGSNARNKMGMGS